MKSSTIRHFTGSIVSFYAGVERPTSLRACASHIRIYVKDELKYPSKEDGERQVYQVVRFEVRFGLRYMNRCTGYKE